MTPMLETENLNETVTFWSEVLGFETVGFEKDYWAKLSKGNLS